MPSAGIVSLLAGRILQARIRAWGVLAQGKDARPIEAVGRSCRRTLAWVVQPRDPGEIPAMGFSLVVSRTGEILVLHRERPLAVSRPYLRRLFRDAGVDLASGETLLLDPSFVKLLVDEALGAVHREETLLTEVKARLLSASQEAESAEPSGSPLPMRECPSPEDRDRRATDAPSLPAYLVNPGHGENFCFHPSCPREV